MTHKGSFQMLLSLSLCMHCILRTRMCSNPVKKHTKSCKVTTINFVILFNKMDRNMILQTRCFNIRAQISQFRGFAGTAVFLFFLFPIETTCTEWYRTRAYVSRSIQQGSFRRESNSLLNSDLLFFSVSCGVAHRTKTASRGRKEKNVDFISKVFTNEFCYDSIF